MTSIFHRRRMPARAESSLDQVSRPASCCLDCWKTVYGGGWGSSRVRRVWSAWPRDQRTLL